MTRWSLFLQTLSLLHHFLGLYYEHPNTPTRRSRGNHRRRRPRVVSGGRQQGGVGSFVVFWEGIYMVQVHTAMPEGQAPLREVAQLVQLASGVKERLP